MLDSNNPKQLIVEGADDLHAVVGLMRDHVDWPPGPHYAPVFIHNGGGLQEILKGKLLQTYIKQPTVKIFGVIVDADTAPGGTYKRIRQLCIELFPTMPESLSEAGLIVANDDDKRFGVWIMPNNMSQGNLETFLKYLVPEDAKEAWEHAVKSVDIAKNLGCPCLDSHTDKANLYTWLSWQNPPGQSAGVSLTKRVLDPRGNSGALFVAWFRNLYELPPRESLF